MFSGLKDTISQLSPWNTQVVISNQCSTSIVLFLAHDPADPKSDNAYEMEVPANQDYPINSGWLHEPKATILLRTGLHEAKLIRSSDHCRIVVSPTAHGLQVESTDAGVTIEDYADFASVTNHDTAPMVMRGEHFDAAAAGSNKAEQATTNPAVHDTMASMSPWNTQVVFHNQCNTPVLVFLARDAAKPSPHDAQEFKVPPDTDFPVTSGWLKEPKATLLMRTGLHEAKLMLAANAARIVVSNAPHGLKVESTDDVTFEAYADSASVPQIDTAPMIMRSEKFADIKPTRMAPTFAGAGGRV